MRLEPPTGIILAAGARGARAARNAERRGVSPSCEVAVDPAVTPTRIVAPRRIAPAPKAAIDVARTLACSRWRCPLFFQRAGDLSRAPPCRRGGRAGVRVKSSLSRGRACSADALARSWTGAVSKCDPPPFRRAPTFERNNYVLLGEVAVRVRNTWTMLRRKSESSPYRVLIGREESNSLMSHLISIHNVGICVQIG